MPENNGWFEKHVVDALERLENGQNTMILKFENHEKADATQFEDIRTELAINRTVQDTTAKTSAKMWSAIGTGAGIVISSAIHFLTRGK